MKTKFIHTCFLTAALLASMPAFAYDFEVDGMYFNIVSLPDLTCELTYGDNEYTGDFIIPEQVTYNNRTLTVVGIHEASNSDNNKGVFENCIGLTSISIPNSIIYIGNRTFYGCTSLTNINIPNSVTSIGDYALYGCTGLTSVSIPNSVTSIGDYALYGCSGLTSISIPNSVTSIGDYALCGCSGLTSVSIPNSVTSIGDYTLYGCSGLTSISIPNSVTSIGDYALCGCSGLTSISIPNSVTSIGDYALYGCSGLTSISIPNSVRSIGKYALANCSKLSDVTIEGLKNSSITIYQSSFINSPIESFYLGKELDGGFNSNKFISIPSLKKLTIGRYVTKLYSWSEQGMFDCSNLKELIFEDSPEVLTLGRYGSDYDTHPASFPFILCHNIESLYLGRHIVVDDDKDYFSQFISANLNLRDVTIGVYITHLDFPFSHNENISAIKLYTETPPQISEDCFTNKQYINANVTVPKGSLSKYQADEVWRNFWNIEESEDIKYFNVDGIRYFKSSDTEVYVCKKDEPYSGDISIPSKVSYLSKEYDVVAIDDGVFYNCYDLTSIKLSDRFTTINDSLFKGCTGLTSVELGDNLSYIGASAFEGCTGLTSIELGDNLSYIGASAFKGCTNLSLLSIPASVTTFGMYAFTNCRSLKTLIFEDGDTPLYFPNGSFEGSTDYIEKYVNGKTVQFKIEYYLGYFNDLPIEKLYIGRNLDDKERYNLEQRLTNQYTLTQYDGPFENLPNLKELTIGKYVSTIGPRQSYIYDLALYVTPGSFTNCGSLEQINVGSAVPPTGAEFSKSVYQNASLIVPEKYVETYKDAEGWKEFYNITTNIDNVKTSPKLNVKVENGNIIIYDAIGTVSVYDVTGTLIKYVRANSGTVEISVPCSGIYIVKANNKTTKIIL